MLRLLRARNNSEMFARGGFTFFLLQSLFIAQLPAAIGYSIGSSKLTITLKDDRTGSSPLSTLFLKENATVIVDGISWTGIDEGVSVLTYQTFVDGEEIIQGKINLPDDPLSLPSWIQAGEVFSSKRGSTLIEVKLSVDESETSADLEVQAFKKWMAIIPMIVALILIFAKVRPDISLLGGLFVGGCMVAGSLTEGFKSVTTNYIFNAVSEASHIYIYLFTFCISGLVAILRKSGGVQAVAQRLAQCGTNSQWGQFAVWVAGLFIFFDNYASVMVVGELMTPILQFLPLSIEKLAFLVDTTAAPVSSINPFSSWTGIEASLIQTEIDKITEREGTYDLSIPSGFSVFLKSIKYQYYPIFMLILVPLLILSGRDLGPMLVAQRKSRLYHEDCLDERNRLEAKDGRNLLTEPENDTPRRSWNMMIPVLCLTCFLGYFFAVIDDDELETYPTDFLPALTFSVVATVIIAQLVYLVQRKRNGTIELLGWEKVTHFLADSRHHTGAELNQKGGSMLSPSSRSRKSCTDVQSPNRKSFKDLVQIASSGLEIEYEQEIPAVRSCGESILLSLDGAESLSFEDDVKILRHAGRADEDIEMIATDMGRAPNEEESVASVASVEEYSSKTLLTMGEGVESFLKGGTNVVPILVLLTLAWATSALFVEIGLDRLIAHLIHSDSVMPEYLPTLAFSVSMILSLVLGSSWGTLTLILPLIVVPTYDASDGDAELFYATIGAVLSGAVAGVHISPISDTTILTCLATGCDLRAHVWTQIPYSLVIAVLSILLGTLPVSFRAYPNMVAYFLGAILLIAFVYFVCGDVLHPEGKYDVLTELFISRYPDSELHELKPGTVQAYLQQQEGRPRTAIQADTHKRELGRKEGPKNGLKVQTGSADLNTSSEDTTVPSDDSKAADDSGNATVSLQNCPKQAVDDDHNMNSPSRRPIEPDGVTFTPGWPNFGQPENVERLLSEKGTISEQTEEKAASVHANPSPDKPLEETKKKGSMLGLFARLAKASAAQLHKGLSASSYENSEVSSSSADSENDETSWEQSVTNNGIFDLTFDQSTESSAIATTIDLASDQSVESSMIATSLKTSFETAEERMVTRVRDEMTQGIIGIVMPPALTRERTNLVRPAVSKAESSLYEQGTVLLSPQESWEVTTPPTAGAMVETVPAGTKTIIEKIASRSKSMVDTIPSRSNSKAQMTPSKSDSKADSTPSKAESKEETVQSREVKSTREATTTAPTVNATANEILAALSEAEASRSETEAGQAIVATRRSSKIPVGATSVVYPANFETNDDGTMFDDDHTHDTFGTFFKNLEPSKSKDASSDRCDQFIF